MHKVKLILETIVHATEDTDKIIDSLGFLGIQKQDITIKNMAGHFENPILLLRVEKEKDDAQNAINKISRKLSQDDLDFLRKELTHHIHNSTLYLRISKQDLISGKVSIQDDDSIKIKITVPVFNKKNKEQVFSKLLVKE